MKKLWLFIMVLAGSVCLGKDTWDIKNMPAHYENPGVIKVVPGQTQSLTFYFMTPESVLSTGGRVVAADASTGGSGMTISGKDSHNMIADITLPEGMEYITSIAGDQPVERHEYEINGNRIIDRYVCDKVMLQPKRRLSEWKTYKIAVKVSEKAPAGEEKLTIALSHEGKLVVTKTWKIERIGTFKPAPKLKKLKIGFWDYGNYMLEKAHPGLLEFWKKAGANCFFCTLKNVNLDGFELYGSLHHSNFSNYDQYPTFSPDGKKRRMQLDGWYLTKKPLKELLPNITARQLEHAAMLNCGWTGMDYEPTGVEEGFIPESIEHFKKEYNVSDAEFEKMRKGLIRDYFEYRYGARRAEQKIFDKWNDYQSKLSAGFIKALVADLKKAAPNLKFHNTVLDALPAPDVKGSGIGIDASLQAKYLDMIEPQLYVVGEATSAKYAIMRAREWVDRVDSLNKKCIVHPLLIVRYAAGVNRNSPEYLQQQTIGCMAEGCGGVSYYFIQGFNAHDWAVLADTVRQLAAVEDFYTGGIRCDGDFKVSGAPSRIDWRNQWPKGRRKVVDPDWHMTAHKLNGKVLVTLFNLDNKKDLTVKLSGKYKFDRIVNGKRNADGTYKVEKNKIAYIYFN